MTPWIIDKEVFEKPLFTWLKPCNQCPTAHYPPDPESLDILSWSFKDRIEQGRFPCAWRTKGNCMANQKSTFYGEAFND